MKNLLDLIRQPLVIGAFVLSSLIVGGAYFGSHWYYGDVEPIDIPETSTFVPRPSGAVPEVNLEGLPTESEQTPTESKPTSPTAESESADDFLAELSDEEIALLTAEVVEETQPVSPFGFGPYPEVPLDFPEDPVWVEDPDYPKGDRVLGSDFMREIELIDRVLIKLWTQGRRATSGEMSDGLVYPGYPDTVYVTWSYTEEPDGTMTRKASGVSSGPDVPLSVHDTIIEEGIIPFGITELSHEDDGIDPFTFLNLNQ